MKSAEIQEYINNLEYENKRMGEFLNKLGYTNEAITDVIICPCDTLTKVQVFPVIRSTMDALEKMSDEVQQMRDALYTFLDTHYDFSKFKPSQN